MANRTRLVGREKVLAQLSAIPKRVRAETRKAIEQGAGEIVAMQKRLVPSDSGALRDSIQAVMGDADLPSTGVLATSTKRRKGSRYKGSAGGVARGDADLTATIVAGNREAYYARFVEFGTAARPQGGLGTGTQHPGTRPQPFFYGPFRSLRRKVVGRVTRAMRKAIKAEAK